MVLVNKSLDSMLDKIKCTELTSFDFFNLDEILPGEFSGNPLIYLFGSSGYWVELMKELGPNFYQNLNGPIGHALENAFLRGNEKKRYLPVSLKVFSGRRGKVVRIRDSGQGFDFNRKINLMRAGNQNYFNGKGRGLRTMDKPGALVSYEGNGNTINIMLSSYLYTISQLFVK